MANKEERAIATINGTHFSINKVFGWIIIIASVLLALGNIFSYVIEPVIWKTQLENRIETCENKINTNVADIKGMKDDIQGVKNDVGGVKNVVDNVQYNLENVIVNKFNMKWIERRNGYFDSEREK